MKAMFFKRLAVVFVLFALIVQLTACNKESDSVPSNNSQQATNSQITNSQTQGGEEGNSDNDSSGIRPDEDGYYQDRDEITSDDNDDTDDFEQDNGKNPPTVSCNHSSDPNQNMSKTEFYANGYARVRQAGDSMLPMNCPINSLTAFVMP